jgi:LPXTG-motif cell wall-anchored protein
LAAGSPSSQLTPTAPSRLSTPKSTTSGSLPNTGLNLLPETIAGVALLGAGVGLRARRSRA